MKFKWLVFLCLLSFATASPLDLLQIEPRAAVESENASQRLADTILPQNYDIDIQLSEQVFSGISTTFIGTVDIFFTTTSVNPISEFEIHSSATFSSLTPSITIADEVVEEGAVPTNIVVTVGAFDATTSKLILTTATALSNSENYVLRITYSGQIDNANMQGLYRSSYVNAAGQVEYLVSTQFQPDYARRVFPCFDEPQYKATFSLKITHPSALTALFNTPETTDPAPEDDGTFKTSVFPASKSMSTYLVAFVVSNFDCTTAPTSIAGNIPHQVCSRPDTLAERELANTYGPQLMTALESQTGINYATMLTKMDQVAVPDFSAGAMENWGLVTYREMALLYNNDESSVVDKQRIITIIAHEFAHMWFGNLVTMKWWNNLFLNEGFASYFEYFAPASIAQLETTESWELAKQFVVDQQQYVLQVDASSTTRALSAQASTSAEIWGKFDSLSYLKGAAVIRMAENFMGHNNFIAGIKDYLGEYSYGNAEPTNLWNALQTYAAGSLPNFVSLEGVMDSWINNAGYPVIEVSVSGNDVLISQKRFMYNGTDSTYWYVPISYTTSVDPTQFQNPTPKVWLVPGDYTMRIPDALVNASWIIFNNQESAYYRVNYDNTLWTRIQNALLDDHTVIDVLNRAQIVDDVFNFARAGQLRYTEAINIISYLPKETEYYPLYAAAVNFDTLITFIGESSEIGSELNNLQLSFLEAVKGNVSFENSNPSNHVYTLKRRLILSRLCKLGDQDSVTKAQELFAAHRTNNQALDNDLKPTIYCNGLRYSNTSEDWNFLWNKFQTTRVATEQVTILSALGCTKDKDLINYYLEQSINATSGIRHQDITRVWTSVVANNPENVDVAFDFYSANNERLRLRFASSVSVIGTIASRLTTSEQLERLEALASNTTVNENVRLVATTALNNAKNNYDWATEMRPQLEEHFRKPTDDTDSAVKNVGVTILALLLAFMTTFVY